MLGLIPFDWSYFFDLFGDGTLWKAAWITVSLATIAWAAAAVLGIPIALAEQSKLKPLRYLAIGYVWIFRGIPQLLLIIFVYNAVPQAFPGTSGLLNDPFVAGAIALILSEAAYMAEVFRGSLLAVPTAQRDAGRALGLPYVSLQRLIVLPQALRVAIPPLGNEYIATLKNTSLVSVISLVELTLAGQRIFSQNFLVIETLTCVAVFYLAIASVFTLLQRVLEKRLDVTSRTGPGGGSPWSRLRPWRPRAAGAATGLLQAAFVPRPALALAQGNASASGPRADSLGSPQPPARDAMVRMTDVHKTFRGTEVLRGVDLEVHRGEVVAIIGPSGSGKSTLLRCVNHLETVDDGLVEVNGHLIGYRRKEDGNVVSERDSKVAAQRAEIGMVFQSFNLFPHRTAIDNVTLAPIRLGRYPREECLRRGLELLDKVGLKSHAHHYPHQLSGGQQQRVAIARALAMRPAVMLFDEPTSALDPELVGEVLQVIEDLAREGMTMLVVTHEMQFARRMADRVVFMADGKVVEEGPPARVFGEPSHPRTRLFLEQVLGE